MPLFIFWNFDPEIVNLPMLAPRWYGLLFAIAFYSGYLILRKVWLQEKLSEKSLDTLSWYVIVATLIGARLGHVLFYGPWWDVEIGGRVIQEGYFSHPISILNIREGGLASHGAAIGILIALWLYKRKTKIDRSYLWIVDRLVIVVAIGGFFVRFGNFTNSEIIGKPTDAATGVIFAHNSMSRLDANLSENNQGLVSYDFNSTGQTEVVDSVTYAVYSLDLNYNGSEEEFKEFIAYGLTGVFNTNDPSYRHTSFNGLQDFSINNNGSSLNTTLKVLALPRHPAQLYEAVSYLLLFLILFGIYRKYGTETPHGLLFGVFLTGMFTARFLIEFIKENQVAFEDDLSLNMGQNLSIPFVLIGLALIVYSLKNKTKPTAQ
ncbi:MAG: prolipoprotein diacylglyceryl transferase [Bacteroidia bacterium]